jgi:hypothetical protein
MQKPASSTTKTGRHDIAEILLKVALRHNKSNQIKAIFDTKTGASRPSSDILLSKILEIPI